jgi:tight adherence protein C
MFNLFYILFGITAFFAILAIIVLVLLQRDRSAITKRISQISVQTDEGEEDRPLASYKMARKVSLFATAIRVKLGARANESVEERFTSAGIRVLNGSDVYFVLRIVVPLLSGGIVFLAFHNLFFTFGALLVGYLIPDFFLDRLVAKYRREIRRGMPDMVDLLSVCVESGLGIDQALLRTAREMSISYPELSYEFLETNRERQAGLTRAKAWENLISRCKSEELDMMVTMLNQTDELGTPIIRALRNFADALRSQRRIEAQETSAKASTLILIPLVLFIFPTVFIVVMGPAILTLLDGLSNGIIGK